MWCGNEFSIPINWWIFEEQGFLRRAAVLQSSILAALYAHFFSILAPYIPALYPKAHLLQPLRYHYGCFLSPDIIYPSYTTSVLRKSKKDYFGVQVLMKGEMALLALWCCAVCCHPVALTFQSKTQRKICHQKVFWVKKEVLCLVDR